jgi:NADPH:quinone reductase-like Zn-dependent oxidoreductase
VNLAIIGSRNYPDLDLVEGYVRLLPRDWTIVSGGARGVDSRAVQTAKDLGMNTKVFLPDWSLGRRAALLRNDQIVEASNRVTAFWDGSSTGTAYTMQKARLAGNPVDVVLIGQKVKTVEEVLGLPRWRAVHVW